jgi:hypothetical protein
MSIHHSFSRVFVATLVVGGFIFSPQAAQAKVHKMPSINAQVDLDADVLWARDKKQSEKGSVSFSDEERRGFSVTLKRRHQTVTGEVGRLLSRFKKGSFKTVANKAVKGKKGEKCHMLTFEHLADKESGLMVRTAYLVRPTGDGVYVFMYLSPTPMFDDKHLEKVNNSFRELKPRKSYWQVHDFPSLKVVFMTPKSWKVESLKKGNKVMFQAGNRGDAFTVWFKGKRARDVVASVRYLKEAASKAGLKFHGEQAGIVHLKNRGHKLVFRGAEKGKDGKSVTKQLIYYIVNRASGSYLLFFVSSPARAKKLNDFQLIFNRFGHDPR